MIKLIAFDFDGTLANCKELHFHSLNKALSEVDEKYVITEEEHVSTYDGLSTKKKLNMLVDKKGFPKDKISFVSDLKQKYTIEMLPTYLSRDERLISTLEKLKEEGYLIYMASNAVLKTVELGLDLIGILHLFDRIFSNEDVKNQKPHPEIYLACMVEAGVMPHEMLIVEDAKHGRESAILSGAFVCGVDNPNDTTYEKIKKCIIYANSHQPKIKWSGRDVNVLIPMAGAGSRFKNAGYKLPKPLIPVFGKPMIQQVVDNLNIDGNFIFVVQKQHYEEYNLGVLLPLIAPECKIVIAEDLTEGAACTTLLAKDLINNDYHLLIANSDQYVEWDSCDFMYSMISKNVDGQILTFIDDERNPKWSFVKLNEKDLVVEVAEKNPISNIATVGIYAYNRGYEYVKYAESMISQNIRFNNEFYVCPVYNEYIKDGKNISVRYCKKMWGIGTPQDLNHFLENYKN